MVKEATTTNREREEAREENARKKGVLQAGNRVKGGCRFLSRDLEGATAQLRELQSVLRRELTAALYVPHSFKGGLPATQMGEGEYQRALSRLSQQVGIWGERENGDIRNKRTRY